MCRLLESRGFREIRQRGSHRIMQCHSNVRRDLLLELFLDIEPKLIRYPSLDPKSFRTVVEDFCKDVSDASGTVPS
jgi:hypothetical protein